MSDDRQPEAPNPAEAAAIETWLREEVVPTYDAMKRNPERGLSVGQVFAELRAHSAARRRWGRDPE